MHADSDQPAPPHRCPWDGEVTLEGAYFCWKCSGPLALYQDVNPLQWDWEVCRVSVGRWYVIAQARGPLGEYVDRVSARFTEDRTASRKPYYDAVVQELEHDGWERVGAHGTFQRRVR